MENLIKQHEEKFGVDPVIIGMYWNDQETLFDKIEEAIENGTPYNEYNELTDEEKEDFDDGELVF